MNILILGAASFIGTNLTLALAKNSNDTITLVDKNSKYFNYSVLSHFKNIKIIENDLTYDINFDELLSDQDIVYHLVSTTIPSNSNKNITFDLMSNVIFSSKVFDSCVNKNIKKIIFISSGGTVYGKDLHFPLTEEHSTYPISSYGVQKITIEKLLYLYKYMYGLEYKVIRLSNPYGPFQRPNGMLGAVTTFTFNALNNKKIVVYGDGTVIRDYIYIDDAIKGIVNIANIESKFDTYNLGTGIGTSVNELLDAISVVTGKKLDIEYQSGRKTDVPINYLDIHRYESEFGRLNPLNLKEGIRLTKKYLETICIE